MSLCLSTYFRFPGEAKAFPSHVYPASVGSTLRFTTFLMPEPPPFGAMQKLLYITSWLSLLSLSLRLSSTTLWRKRNWPLVLAMLFFSFFQSLLKSIDHIWRLEHMLTGKKLCFPFLPLLHHHSLIQYLYYRWFCNNIPLNFKPTVYHNVLTLFHFGSNDFYFHSPWRCIVVKTVLRCPLSLAS